MKKLLEFSLANFDFLYSDPGYRIADSRTGSVANAGMTVTGPVLEWTLAIDRGQFSVMVGPSHKSEGAEAFWISLLRQYVENHANIEFLPAVKEVRWARETSTASCGCSTIHTPLERRAMTFERCAGPMA